MNTKTFMNYELIVKTKHLKSIILDINYVEFDVVLVEHCSSIRNKKLNLLTGQ